MIAAGAVVAWFGPIAFDNDDAVRLTATGLALVSLFVLAAPGMIAGAWSSRGDEKLDERDRAILARGPAGQAAAILVVLAVWVIALGEAYRGEPGILGIFLYLVFWSCLLAGLVASNAGVLLSYRQA